jgi:ATP-dependent exoDNAse (exonuclease V) beta subunit
VQSLKKPLKKQSWSSTLNALSTQNTKSEVVGQKLTDSSRIGDLAEHYAITWLWDEGFEVFHNCGCTGAIDIVAIKDGEVYLFDVKTMQYNKDKEYYTIKKGRTDLQKEMGVQLLSFNPSNRKLRMVKHRSI